MKEWGFFNQTWFKLAIGLWIVSIISGLMSTMPLFSTWQGFVWIRFPLYALAVQVWLGLDRDIRIVMFFMMFLGTILMCFILVLELYFEPMFPCSTHRCVSKISFSMALWRCNSRIIPIQSKPKCFLCSSSINCFYQKQKIYFFFYIIYIHPNNVFFDRRKNEFHSSFFFWNY